MRRFSLSWQSVGRTKRTKILRPAQKNDCAGRAFSRAENKEFSKLPLTKRDIYYIINNCIKYSDLERKFTLK